MIVAAVALAANLPTKSGSSKRTHSKSVPPDVSLDQGEQPPKLALADWTLTQADRGGSLPARSEGNQLFLVIVDPKNGFNGPRIKAGIAVEPDGFSAGLSPQQVDVNGVTGQLGIGPDKVYLTWSPAPSHTAYVDGTRATQDQVLTVARGLKLSADLMSATATVVPAGLEVVPLLRSDGATVGRHAG